MTFCAKPLKDPAAAWVEVTEAGVTVAEMTFRPAFLAGLTDQDLAGFGLVVAAVVETPPPVLPDGLAALGTITDVNGQPTRTWSTAHLAKADLAPALTLAVTVERDRRVAGGFTFAGKRIQSHAEARLDILALGVQAQLAVLAGAQAGDLRWLDPANDFAWICADNSLLPLDAAGMAALLTAGVAYKSAVSLTARASKTWLADPKRTRAELLAFDPAAGWPA